MIEAHGFDSRKNWLPDGATGRRSEKTPPFVDGAFVTNCQLAVVRFELL